MSFYAQYCCQLQSDVHVFRQRVTDILGTYLLHIHG